MEEGGSKRGVTEEGRPTLNVDDTIRWVSVNGLEDSFGVPAFLSVLPDMMLMTSCPTLSQLPHFDGLHTLRAQMTPSFLWLLCLVPSLSNEKSN